MSDEEVFHDLDRILEQNKDVYESIHQVYYDLEYLITEFSNHEMTGKDVINTISTAIIELKEAAELLTRLED